VLRRRRNRLLPLFNVAVGLFDDDGEGVSTCLVDDVPRQLGEVRDAERQDQGKQARGAPARRASGARRINADQPVYSGSMLSFR